MSDLFKNVYFLKHFFPRVLVLQLTQLYHFYCYKFASELVQCQINLTKRPISNLLDKFVEI